MSKLDIWQAKINAAVKAIQQSLSQLDAIYIGYSGGLDSSCLLHMIDSLKEKNCLVVAIHINHNLSQEASQWAQFCKSQVEHLENINCQIKKVTVINRGDGIENAARKARWKAFKSIIHSRNLRSALYLGHHLDDQVETFVLRMLRGAGCAGLSSMDKASIYEGIKVIRPLLGISRQDLEAYAENNKLSYINDHSNQDLNIDRNYIRHEIIPRIKRRWPNALSSLQQTIAHIDSDWRLLHEHAKLLMATVVELSYGIPAIKLEQFNQLDSNTRGLILRVHCIEHGWYAPHKRQLIELIRQLEDASSSTKISLIQKQYKMLQYRGWLYIMPAVWFTQAPVIQLDQLNELPTYIQTPNIVKIGWQKAASLVFKHNHRQVKVIFKNEVSCSSKLNKILKKEYQAKHMPKFIREATPILQFEGKVYLGTLTALADNTNDAYAVTGR